MYSKLMATGILVSEEDYLHTSYEPDCEFENGVLIERNAGTLDHGRLQMALAAYFFGRLKAWNLHGFTEVRVRTRTGRYLIPDLESRVRRLPALSYRRRPSCGLRFSRLKTVRCG
jgi:hypothetical protein